jgi:hypothetical protein
MWRGWGFKAVLPLPGAATYLRPVSNVGLLQPRAVCSSEYSPHTFLTQCFNTRILHSPRQA